MQASENKNAFFHNVPPETRTTGSFLGEGPFPVLGVEDATPRIWEDVAVIKYDLILFLIYPEPSLGASRCILETAQIWNEEFWRLLLLLAGCVALGKLLTLSKFGSLICPVS